MHCLKLASAADLTDPRRACPLLQDWTREEIQAIYDMPFIELLYRAATVHRMYFNPREVQQCTLISIKTGGCTEDCKYCSQVGLIL